jgi:hypothetical protein
LLGSDGSPVNLLHNQQYTCHKPIPWLAAALQDGPESSNSISDLPSKPEVGDPTTISHPEDGPSTTAATHLNIPQPWPERPASPANSVPPLPCGPSMEEEPVEAGLDNLFRSSSCQLECVSPFTKIKGGCFPGFREYLTRPSKKCLRVVFPIIPQYNIFNKNFKSTPYINSMDISYDDADAIYQVEPQCLYAADDQGDCPEGQVRYFCSSWVSGYHFFLFGFLKSHVLIARFGFGVHGTQGALGSQAHRMEGFLQGSYHSGGVNLGHFMPSTSAYRGSRLF